MLNKVFIIGNLGKDPEVRFTSNGKAVAKFSVATSERWTDQDGNKQERTEWHNVVVWGKQAETCGQYLAKGRQVFVEGRLKQDRWESPEGKKMSKVRVIAENVTFLGAEDSLRAAGVEVAVPQDAECIRMMREFIERNPELWNEDIGR